MIEDELLKLSNYQEHWSQIDNYSRYWISDLGQVYDAKRHKLARKQVEYDGYILVNLTNDNHVVKSKRVHRLVAEAFLPNWNPEWPWTVNHINGKKDDNRLCNLEMLTVKDNNKHYQTAECFAESRKLARASISSKMKEKCSDPDYALQMSNRMKTVWKDPNKRVMYVNCLLQRQSNPSNRKQVSEKLKIICSDPEYKKGMSDRQKAQWDNPDYRRKIMSQNQDRVWVHNSEKEKWIHSSELTSYLLQGFEEGRLSTLVPSTTGKVRINNGEQNKFIHPSELDLYLANGWKLGRSNKKRVQCIETGTIFDSVEECAQAFNTNTDLIHSRCKGNAKNFRKLKELHFRYYEDKKED